MFFVVQVIVVFVFNFPTPSKEFQVDTRAELPKTTQDLHFASDRNFWGRGESYYCFHCDSHDTEMLIKAMNLQEDKTGDPRIPSPRKPDWPDARSWQGTRIFNRFDPVNLTSRTLITDKNETQVYVFVSD